MVPCVISLLLGKGEMSAQTTDAPCFAKAKAVARPRPEVAPVTMAIFPISSPVFILNENLVFYNFN